MTLQSLSDPVSPQQVVDFINSGKQRGHTITVYAECVIEYEGRSTSDIGAGDRIIVMKPDGAVLVHKDENTRPVNWQPSGSSYRSYINDDTAIIEAYRTNPTEEVIVTLTNIDIIVSKKLVDDKSLSLRGTESDVVDKLVDNPDLIESGFRIIEREWETGEGPVDIYGRDETGETVCVEVKRGQINPRHIEQLRRYVEAVKQKNGPNSSDTSIRGIVVGSGISERGQKALEREQFNFSSVNPDFQKDSQSTTLEDF